MNPSKENAGQYEAIIKNRVGSETSIAFVEVMPKPLPPKVTTAPPAEIKATTGDDVTIAAEVQAHPSALRYSIHRNRKIEIGSGDVQNGKIQFTLKVCI